MGDCSNVEMRELLPDRIADTLSAADARRVDEHLATCEMCTFEVTVLEAARASLRRARPVDVRRISLAVAAASHAVPVRPRSRMNSWGGWRAAASIALVAVGATSVALWKRAEPPLNTGVAQTASPLAKPVATSAVVVATTPAAPAARGLSVAGGLSDLSDTELESLLGDIGSLDAANVAEPEDVIPAIGGVEGVQ